MIIAGAGGLGTQLFEDIKKDQLPDIAFWSEHPTRYSFIAEHYPILDNDEALSHHFHEVSASFILCVGGKPQLRKQLCERLIKLGGILTTYISPYSRVSPYGTSFGRGTLILNQVNVEPSVTMGEGCLLNKTANVGHGCILASWCEIGPGAILTGEVELGENCYVGTAAIIHPKIKIGNNAIIAAGAVVTKNIPNYAVVAGPSAEIKYIRKHEGEHLHDNVQP